METYNNALYILLICYLLTTCQRSREQR